MSRLRKPKRKVWKIGQSRSYPWNEAAAGLFLLTSNDTPPSTFKARLNKLTVTLTCRHLLGGLPCTSTVRVDRREFFQ